MMQGIFGMNVRGLTADGVPWTLVAKVAIPGVCGLFLVILVGRFIWNWISGREKWGGPLHTKPFFGYHERIGTVPMQPTFWSEITNIVPKTG